jgi:hypothetical protein
VFGSDTVLKDHYLCLCPLLAGKALFWHCKNKEICPEITQIFTPFTFVLTGHWRHNSTARVALQSYQQIFGPEQVSRCAFGHTSFYQDSAVFLEIFLISGAMSSSFRGAGFLPDGSIHGTECGNPHCKKHDTPIQKCYKCVKCQTYLHPPTLFFGSMETSCSMPYDDDGAICCNEEIVGNPCHYKDEYREHINRVMGNGKSNIPAAASIPSPPAAANSPASPPPAANNIATGTTAASNVPKKIFAGIVAKRWQVAFVCPSQSLRGVQRSTVLIVH